MDLFEAAASLLCIIIGLFLAEKFMQAVEKDTSDEDDLGTGI
jgi:hypothetical protein